MPESSFSPDKTPKRQGRYKPKGRQVDPARLRLVADVLRPHLQQRGLQRDRLIEYLHILQDKTGYLLAADLAALADLMRLPMAEIWEVASFYDHFDLISEGETPPPPRTIRVCTSLSCMIHGSHDLLAELQAMKSEHARFVAAPCLGACDKAPAAADGHHLIPIARAETLRMTADAPEQCASLEDYSDFDAYCDAGGYQLVKALSAGKADKQVLLAELEASALRGLGGAGFPTGRKWRIVSSYDGPRNLAVNGDEGEPGTFKDRHYLSTDPHRMIEGVLIAAHIVGIEKAYIYMRDEYPEIIEMLHTELAKVTKAGFDAHVDIELRRGAGAYICGEESAMIESIEGKRGLPRHRPPYVAETGLFGQPTLVNNIETLFWVRDILEHGAEWYNQQGKEGHPGFRTYSVSGRVKEPGLVTASAGSTADELIAACGGMADGHNFKAYLPGGASGGILPASKAHIPLDFGGSLAEEGCFVGSHAVVILSDKDNVWKAAQNLMQFFAHESCGQCTPCRSGTDKAAELMAASCPDTNLLGELAATMADASICGLGQAAPNPLLSAIKHFPQDIMQGDVGQNESLAAKAKPSVEKA